MCAPCLYSFLFGKIYARCKHWAFHLGECRHFRNQMCGNHGETFTRKHECPFNEFDFLKGLSVAANQLAFVWPQVSTLTTYTPHLPPHTHGSRVGQTSIPATRTVNRPALTIYLSCIYLFIALKKPLYTEPLSVTVLAVFGTCMVLVWLGR